MFRRIVCAILRLALRVYFRRIEVAGLQNVPRYDPVIFVLNHPNALVDPAFLLCLAPRPVSFIAKAPLFHMPVIGYLVRALDSLPAYRRQDEGQDVSRNLETFTAARKLLARGGTIGICPEGVSHNEPRLKPLKSGTARIALAAVSSGEVNNLKVVPVGLYYTEKMTFRSSALLYFGAPMLVRPVVLNADGTPPRESVRKLSNQIEEAMREVMLHAEHEEAVALIARAEKILSAEETNGPTGRQTITRSLELRQRLLDGYAFHRTRSPQRIEAVAVRIARLEHELEQAGLDPFDLSLPRSRTIVILGLLARVFLFSLLAPIAFFGVLVHFPAYRLAGYLSLRFSRDEQDVISTFKIISAMLFFPLTWLFLALIAWQLVGWPSGLATLVVTPLAGYVGIRFFEELDRFAGSLSALMLFLMQRRSFVRLLAERAAIRREILALGEETPLPS